MSHCHNSGILGAQGCVRLLSTVCGAGGSLGTLEGYAFAGVNSPGDISYRAHTCVFLFFKRTEKLSLMGQGLSHHSANETMLAFPGLSL